MPELTILRVAQIANADEFRQRLAALHLELPCDDAIMTAAQGSPMGQPLDLGDGLTLGNRWCIHPMEGWDATATGEPSEHTLRRWEHFGASGAKLVWGGEAFAVQEDGRSNPHQSGIVGGDLARGERALVKLFDAVMQAHKKVTGRSDDVCVGLQLTHSGRFSFPHDKTRREPKIAYHHPILDRRCGIAPDDHSVVMSDDDLLRLIDNYIAVAKIAQRVGFHFVDVKHCHGYLGHELLSARARPGQFGGSLENRTRFARTIVQGIQAACPGLRIGIRLSVFDMPPYKPDPALSKPGKPGPGVPEEYQGLLPYTWGFGVSPANPLEMDLREPIEFIHMMMQMGVKLWNITAGSPYYNPHIQRPAALPPSDAYRPPEDPLAGVVRQIHATRKIKDACPGGVFVGSGYTYLQDFLPHVAQALVRQGWVDSVGIGRMVLACWELPWSTLQNGTADTKRLCRTISDCTTAPRNGLISGCFPLDPYYKDMPENETLKEKKKAARQ